MRVLTFIAALAFHTPAQPQDLGAPFAAVTSGDGASITLHLGRGPCVGDAMAAIWRPPAGDQRAPVLGCWVLASSGQTVLVSFLDGDRGDIPTRVLIKARAL
jgi:hypothetical protein